MDRVSQLSRTISEDGAAGSDVPRNPEVTEVDLKQTSPAHPDVCQHLRRVVQELVDTEKSYVKVRTTLVPLRYHCGTAAGLLWYHCGTAAGLLWYYCSPALFHFEL